VLHTTKSVFPGFLPITSTWSGVSTSTSAMLGSVTDTRAAGNGGRTTCDWPSSTESFPAWSTCAAVETPSVTGGRMTGAAHTARGRPAEPAAARMYHNRPLLLSITRGLLFAVRPRPPFLAGVEGENRPRAHSGYFLLLLVPVGKADALLT